MDAFTRFMRCYMKNKRSIQKQYTRKPKPKSFKKIKQRMKDHFRFMTKSSVKRLRKQFLNDK